MITIRVCALFDQVVYGTRLSLNMAVISGRLNQSESVMNISLPLAYSVATGNTVLSGVPMNVRHTIDQNSPLYGMDGQTKTDLMANVYFLDLMVQGVDKVTGRGVGVHINPDTSPNITPNGYSRKTSRNFYVF
jgi:hypothetical protein